MQQEELLSLKETGQKGDFLLPYMVARTVMPDFYTTYPMHWHDEMEIVYVEKGRFEEYIDLESYQVKEGDIIIINPCLLHSFKQADDVRSSFRTIIFDLSMLTGNNTKQLMPMTAIIGGIYLLIVDDLARCMLATEIPIGILTAFVGAPFFIFILLKKPQ